MKHRQIIKCCKYSSAGACLMLEPTTYYFVETQYSALGGCLMHALVLSLGSQYICARTLYICARLQYLFARPQYSALCTWGMFDVCAVVGSQLIMYLCYNIIIQLC